MEKVERGLGGGGGRREGDVQVAAVRMMRRAQWFLMSLPIVVLVLLFNGMGCGEDLSVTGQTDNVEERERSSSSAWLTDICRGEEASPRRRNGKKSRKEQKCLYKSLVTNPASSLYA